MVDVVMFVIMCFSFSIAYIILFGGLAHLIQKYAKGKVQKVLYAVLAVVVLYEIILFCIFLEKGYASVVGLLVSLLLFAVGKSPWPIISSMMGKHGAIYSLKGYHIYGLSANEGIKVSAHLYDDGITFRYGNNEMESINTAEIVRISSCSEKEIVGATTTGKSRTGLASTVALMNGDLAAAYFLRPKTTTYTTKNKAKNYWFFVLDTTTISVILQVKSRSALHYFVDLCNDTLHHHADDYNGENSKNFDAEEKISIADMSGADFEQFCADLLRLNGFSNVAVTPSSGDQGVDIIAKKEGIKYAIQCKHYSSPVGNTPVQEVSAGKLYYHCHVGVVLTNSIFTKGATELAKAADVLLWDSYKLHELIENAGLDAEYS